MDNAFIGNWQEFSKSALAAAKELETINTKIFEKLTGKQMEFANTAFESGTRYVAALGDIKDYPSLVAEQSKIVQEYNETLMESARVSADLMTEAREAYQSWIEQGLKIITSNADFSIPGFAPTAKKASKKAA